MAHVESWQTLGVHQDIKNFPCPPCTLHVEWHKAKLDKPGTVFTPAMTQAEPHCSWGGDSNHLYTLIMMDPDAPSRSDPQMREFRHWVVVNIPGDNVSKGEVLTPYMGPAPPKGTGLHRYILCVYRQADKVLVPEKIKVELANEKTRAKWNMHDFVTKVLGKSTHCAAGNVFQAENK